jgi:hypothetical protein
VGFPAVAVFAITFEVRTPNPRLLNESAVSNEAIIRRRENRRAFLALLYEAVDGSVSEFVSAQDIGAQLQLGEVEVRKIFEYLEEKGLVMVDDHRTGIIRITAAGVDEVEAAA